MSDLSENVYEADLASTPRDDESGVRDLVMTDRWNTPIQRPNGGYVLAAMLRGLHEHMGDGVGDPLVAAITYHGPPSVGPAELACRTLRRGRRVQSGEATLVQDGRLVTSLAASFGAREGVTHDLGTPPELPAASSLPDPRELGFGGTGIFERVDYRLTEMPSFLTGEPSGRAHTEGWQRRGDGQVADWWTLAFMCDSFVPAVLDVDPTLSSVTVQLTVHLYRQPTTPWVATRISTHHLADGLHDEDCELWSEDGHLLAQSRQLAMLI